MTGVASSFACLGRGPLLWGTPCESHDARVAELADARDLGSRGQPWGFESPLSHCRGRLHRLNAAWTTPKESRRTYARRARAQSQAPQVEIGAPTVQAEIDRAFALRRPPGAASRDSVRARRRARARAHVRRAGAPRGPRRVWSRTRSTTPSTSTTSRDRLARDRRRRADARRGAPLLRDRRRPARHRRSATSSGLRRRPARRARRRRRGRSRARLAARVGRPAAPDRRSTASSRPATS